MRPHWLEVTAFGAFAGTVKVDFDDLSSSGLFLLHGETGAGKTTLLDALGFALYGRVPGDRNAARRLRSDHAGATARTSVRLEATVGGRRLRITRCPEQARPKVRGEGTTTEPAKVLLEQRGVDGWVAISTRVGEADQEIADRLGMTADQFFQVILLPQGEFARFLRAPSDDRVVLLEKLFGTDRFRDVEAWLAERRRTSSQALGGHRGEIERRAGLLAQVAEVDPPEGLPDEVWAGDLAFTAASLVEVAARTVDERARELDAARGRAEATRALAQRQARRVEADRRARELTAADASIAELERELAAAVAATAVAPLLAALVAADAALDAARAADGRARVRLVAAGVEDDLDPAALRAGARDCEQRQGRLADLQAVAADADRERAFAATARAAEAELAANLAAAEAAVPALAAQRIAALAQRDAARAAAVELPAAQRKADALADAARTAADVVRAATLAADLRVRHIEARELAATDAEEHLRLRRDRVESMAAELAAKLTDGDPCPVCGSCDHPDKPVLHGGHVTRAQEEAAGEAAERSRATAERVGVELAGGNGRVDELLARLGALATTPAAELATRAATAGADRDAIAERAAALESLDATLSAGDARLAELNRMRAAAEQQRDAAVRDAAAADARAARHEATLAERLDGAQDLAAAIAEAVEAAAARTLAADCRVALERAAGLREDAVVAASEAATAAGFDDRAGAALATRTTEWRARAGESVRTHRTAVDGVAALLAEPDLVDVPTMPPADIAGATAAVSAATEEHSRAVHALAAARSRVAQLDKLAPQLTAALAALGPAAAEAEQLRGLAELVAGQGANTRRMTLSAFVLAARLEEVAEVASQRLLRMTQGRYALVHTDTGRDGRRRAGLGLLARDAWTGVDRETATLSGGETFLASLALALGLADVVCAESGGARLESLFVDEGFGSLDSDTLDEVMDVLDGLREGGRVVGIVSHVAELRARIPAQLHVRKHESGSDLEIVT